VSINVPTLPTSESSVLPEPPLPVLVPLALPKTPPVTATEVSPVPSNGLYGVNTNCGEDEDPFSGVWGWAGETILAGVDMKLAGSDTIPLSPSPA